MPYIHVVAFTYLPEVTDSEKSELVKSLKALKTECVNEQGKPYILDFKLGEDNISPEGVGKGFEVSKGADRTTGDSATDNNVCLWNARSTSSS
jgi:hypothetical protein